MGSGGSRVLEVEIDAPAMTRVLAAVAVAGVVVSTGAGMVMTRLEPGAVADVLARVEPGAEMSPLTWFSSGLLLACALALLACWQRSRASGPPVLVPSWLGLAVLFAGLSAEEFVAVHENLGDWWLPTAAGVGVAIGVAAWRPWTTLSSRGRRAWVAAVVLFVGGAVVTDELTEIVLGSAAITIPRMLLRGVEEGLELAGTIVFLESLLLSVSRRQEARRRQVSGASVGGRRGPGSG
jgi:hypothetical protein